MPVLRLAGAGRKDLEQRYQGSSGSSALGPRHLGKDQALLKSDKLTLETVWRRGEMDEGKEKGEAK